MNHDLTVSKSIVILASPSDVWDTLTNKEKIAKFLFGSECLCDWHVGSEIIFQGEYEGHQYRDKGVIKAITPERYMQYTYWSGFSGLPDEAENYSLVTYELNSTENGVQLSVEQKGFAAEENLQHATAGWESALALIKQISET